MADKVEQLEKKLAEKEAELGLYKVEIKKLNAQLRELIEQISQEIKQAQLIQRTLVPTEIPTIPGFEFSSKFVASFVSGGDYFDIFEHDDKFRFGIVLSCGSGYGMSALFLSVLMKLSGQIEARKPTAPSEALAAIFRDLEKGIQEDESADIFFAVVDRRTYELHYCLSGEVAALHFVVSEQGIVRLKSQAPAFTKGFHGELKTVTVPLNPRDRLVFCSRGVIDAQNAQGESFGIKGVEAAIFGKKDASVHELRNEILFQVEQFSNKKEPDRDLTVLVIEAKDRVLKLART